MTFLLELWCMTCNVELEKLELASAWAVRAVLRILLRAVRHAAGTDAVELRREHVHRVGLRVTALETPAGSGRGFTILDAGAEAISRAEDLLARLERRTS